LNDVLVRWDGKLGESTVVSHEAWRGREIRPAIVIEVSAEHINLFSSSLLDGIVLLLSGSYGGYKSVGNEPQNWEFDIGVAVEDVLGRSRGEGRCRRVDSGGGAGPIVVVVEHVLVLVVVSAVPFFAVEPVLEGVIEGGM
jgi:hypothetical protein